MFFKHLIQHPKTHQCNRLKNQSSGASAWVELPSTKSNSRAKAPTAIIRWGQDFLEQSPTTSPGIVRGKKWRIRSRVMRSFQGESRDIWFDAPGPSVLESPSHTKLWKTHTLRKWPRQSWQHLSPKSCSWMLCHGWMDHQLKHLRPGEKNPQIDRENRKTMKNMQYIDAQLFGFLKLWSILISHHWFFN